MPRLRRKSDLFARFDEAVRLSGWSLLYLSKLENPAKYQVYRDGRGGVLKVYLWNITPGGRNRPPDEYRIQPTGLPNERFEIEAGARTLVLGWWEDVGVFAGWDVRQHPGKLGASSSLQINEATLRRALLTGFAPYVKGNGETAIAFRPDFMGTYITHLEALHDSGTVPAEAELLDKLGDDPAEVKDEDIDAEVDEKRRFAIRATRRALRAMDFAGRVLGAYGHRCAMCGVQLGLIDGAHILPAAQPASTDQTSNGVALCALHHRAYDRSLVTFDADLTIHLNVNRIAALRASDRIEGLKRFEKALRPMLIVPPDKRDRPAPPMVKQANALRGWKL